MLTERHSSAGAAIFAAEGDGKYGLSPDADVVDEALYLFRANVLFRNYEVQGHGDRVLIYLTLLIHQVRGWRRLAMLHELS